MNQNRLITEEFSSLEASALYEQRWPDEPELARRADTGEQCGGCSFFAPFNEDYGLCCHPESRHHLETVFEHFTCPAYCGEGWGPHSFTTNTDYHCRCDGEPLERPLTATPSAAEVEPA